MTPLQVHDVGVADWSTDRRFAVVLIGLWVLALVLRGSFLGSQSYWVDEVNGIRLASGTLAEILRDLKADVSPPLYYVLLHIWTKLFGTAEVATRALSAIFGFLTVPLISFGTWSFFRERRTVLLATGLAALNPFHLHFSQECRMYSLLALLTLLTLVLLHRALSRGGAGGWAAFGAAALATLYTHNYGMFGVIACGAYALLVLNRHRAAIKPFSLSVACIAVGYLPWFAFMLVYQVGSSAIEGWIPLFRWQMIPETLLYYAGLNMFGLDSLCLWPGLAVCLAGFVAPVVVYFGRGRGAAGKAVFPEGLVALLCLVGLGAGLPMLISVWMPIFLPYRYSVVVWTGFPMLLGWGLSRIRPRPLLGMVIVAYLVSAGAGLYWYYAIYEKGPDRYVAGRIREALKKDDLVVFSPHWTGITMNYYLPEIPAQLGYPEKALAERALQSETAEAEPRSLEELLLLIDNHFRSRSQARLVLVKGMFGWEPAAAELETALMQRYRPGPSMRASYLQVSIFQRPAGEAGAGPAATAQPPP